MIGISFIFSAILFTIVWMIFRVNYYKKNKPINRIREIFINLFFIYFLILVNLTLFKYGDLMIDFDNRFYINYIPLVETIKMFNNNFTDIHTALYNVIGNILLFIPLGFGIPLFFNKKNKLFKIILYGFTASLFIESIQIFTPNNFTDIDDIIFNTFGSVLGFLIFNIIYMIFKKTKIESFINSISNSYDGNLLLVIGKPIGTIILFFSFLSFGLLYNETIPGNLSNEELAVEVLGEDTFENYKTARDFENYKFLLTDNGEFIELKNLKRFFNNRWYDEKFNSSFQIASGDYSVMTLIENNLISGVAFGKNKDANIIEINFNGTKYIENIVEDDYFIVPFPKFVKANELTDFHRFFDNEKSTELEIKFYDKDGNECPYIKFT
ncbi:MULTISPECIES: VanZ family protein [unclassified Clostridium]|uniref:VanZ family protein n=1 Tax=unclassified Clostridium TaxID=2614128 RepID=UPI001C8BFD4F|nr:MULTISPECIES: VanZ family protein [unclassified Clostridium]MBX9137507.1 VanZ family protein [Clostridium sp. K12(2020)]MBX9144317.1 VanZ family protein [Clostridium sp. K13]